MASDANGSVASGGPPEAIRRFFQVSIALTSPEGIQKAAQFRPEATDVIISTAAKSGTTWVQQICHQLRSGGDMSFEEINLVVPTIEMAHDFGCQPLESPQSYTPRMFKTHKAYATCPKGAGKYIVIARRPEDVAVSFYRFMAGWTFDPNEISCEEYVDWIVLQQGVSEVHAPKQSQIHHILSWYEHRKESNVLWLHYDDLQQDLRECVRLIAEFLDIGRDDERLQELVVQQSALEFMKKNQSKFDAHPIKLARNEAAGLPKDAGKNNALVRDGKSSKDRSPLPQHVIAKIHQLWKDVITPETGYESYEDFRNGINKELGRNFT